ncbi:hypothetical protein BHM03_00020902 [Ensete ventricosum]|nr:hypothetical protein BHM03_00020902 [Ensete ventricosum]
MRCLYGCCPSAGWPRALPSLAALVACSRPGRSRPPPQRAWPWPTTFAEA